MPLYEYKCKKCGNIFEKVFPLERYNERPDCPECNGQSDKTVCIGGIQDDHPVWLDRSIINQLQDTDSPETQIISTRTEFNQLLKDTGTVAV